MREFAIFLTVGWALACTSYLCAELAGVRRELKNIADELMRFRERYRP